MEKIDKKNMKIMYELDKNCRQTDSQIARKIKLSKNSTNQRIKKLENKELIKKYQLWIDYPKLGYFSYKLYLNLTGSPEEKKRFFEHIKKQKNLFAFFTGDGSWEVGLSFFAKNHNEFYKIEEQLIGEYENLITKKITCNMVEAIIKTKDFLTGIKGEERLIWNKPSDYQLDEVEKQILSKLHNNARAKIVDLVNKTDSTLEIIRNRMKKLEKNKIIALTQAEINYQKIGYNFFKSFVYLKKSTKEKKGKTSNIFKTSTKCDSHSKNDRSLEF
jgi:Lrp/AsnC family leucine-responsive transcriptional regulator